MLTQAATRRAQLTKNTALALALLALALLFYVVSVVRMTEVEEQRHRANPDAHNPSPR